MITQEMKCREESIESRESVSATVQVLRLAKAIGKIRDWGFWGNSSSRHADMMRLQNEAEIAAVIIDRPGSRKDEGWMKLVIMWEAAADILRGR